MLIRLLKRPDRHEVTPESFCSTGHTAKSRKQRCAPAVVRRPTDQPIVPMPGELEAVRTMLAEIEGMLAALFGTAYDRGPVALAARAKATALVEADFDNVVEEWAAAVEKNFQDWAPLNRDCQEGMLARAKPSQFNFFHIALKQVILNLVRAKLRGRHMELVRDVVVAAIDERRLMVAQFYIESRENALRASEEKYRNSIDHAPDPMYEIDPVTLEVLSVNSAALELHHRMPSDRDIPLVGQRLPNLVPHQLQPLVYQHIETVRATGSGQAIDLELRGHYFDIHSALITAGKRQFLQMILHDVSQRHEMLDSLLKAERLAAAGTFASGVAHEVNNPLASISSLVQSLVPDETDVERRQTLHTILSQITRISRTLKDLLNFARPAPGEHKPINLNETIAETLRLVAYNKRFARIRMEPVLAPDLVPIFADGNGIQQVLLNLVFNAADALQQDGGVVNVTTEYQRPPQGDGAGRVRVRIIDNGVGIPPDNLKHVFEPFFTTKPAGAGAGLGLSLCQRIILNNHGTIGIESAIGKGTTVTICLPAHVDVDKSATAASLQ
jgi:signal transduction histidine kinase